MERHILMLRATAKLPAGVNVKALFDTQIIDGSNAVSALSFFKSNASQVNTDNNYITNPLPGPYYNVVLGLSIETTMQVIEDDSTHSIDAVKVVNSLKDATVYILSNGGTERKVLLPLKDYMNFAQTKANVSLIANTAPAYVAVNAITLQSTGLRRFENLFYFEPNEAFQFQVLFYNTSWPTTANWTAHGSGRFGLVATMYTAPMTKLQLDEYNNRLLNAAA